MVKLRDDILHHFEKCADALDVAEKRIAELELALDVQHNMFLGEEAKRIALETENAQIVELSDLIKQKADEYKAERDELKEVIYERFTDECAYCGMLFPPSKYEEARAHVDVCPDNPKNKRISELEAENAELRRVLGMVEIDRDGECCWCRMSQYQHAPDCPRQKVLHESEE